MNTEAVDAAFRAASAALDEAWRLYREAQLARPSYRVETLSASLAEPIGHQAELILSNARTVIQCDADRVALIAIARACHVQGLVSNPALGRLLKDFAI